MTQRLRGASRAARLHWQRACCFTRRPQPPRAAQRTPAARGARRVGTAHDLAAAGDDDGPHPAAAAPGLTVHVTGGGKPVAQADVRFKFASGVSLDRRTNAEGIAQIQPPSEGEATVRVIAVGWSSAQRDIVVKRGKPIELAIQLRR
ncbi:MAG: hypothetical protein U1F53_00570 [Burkholderiaceae bacterium]